MIVTYFDRHRASSNRCQHHKRFTFVLCRFFCWQSDPTRPAFSSRAKFRIICFPFIFHVFSKTFLQLNVSATVIFSPPKEKLLTSGVDELHSQYDIDCQMLEYVKGNKELLRLVPNFKWYIFPSISTPFKEIFAVGREWNGSISPSKWKFLRSQVDERHSQYYINSQMLEYVKRNKELLIIPFVRSMGGSQLRISNAF